MSRGRVCTFVVQQLLHHTRKCKGFGYVVEANMCLTLILGDIREDVSG